MLWVALVLNGGMFLTEIVAGLAAGGMHLTFALAKTLSPPFCTNIGSALS